MAWYGDILGFPLCLLKPLFLLCLVILYGHKKVQFSKTDSRNENARLFYLRTQIVFAYFSKNVIKNVLFTTNQKHYFSVFYMSFPYFHIFSFSFSSKKTAKTKTHFLFRKPFFLYPDNLQDK